MYQFDEYIHVKKRTVKLIVPQIIIFNDATHFLLI